jgi:D-alanyl-D-alanine carboxypeptidase
MVVHRVRLGLLALVLAATAACGGDTSDAGEPGGAGSSSASSGSTGGTAAADIDAVAAALRTEAEGYAALVPGIAIVLRIGDEERTVAVGEADARTGAPMSADRRVEVASVSKPMVATVVMDLVDEGAMSLDDTVEDLLPGVLPRGDEITVEMLLDHTSGIPTYDEAAGFRGFGRQTPRQLVALVAEEDPVFEPGSRGAYSNTNYVLLGLLLEEVTGRHLGGLLQDRVFGPAGMHHASYGAQGVPAKQLARGYEGGEDVSVYDQPHVAADTGVVASPVDVADFLEALTAGELVPPAVAEEMLAGHSELDGGPYGLGVATKALPCGDAVGHLGGLPGFSTNAWTMPDRDRTVVVAVTDNTKGYVGTGLVRTALCS